MKTNDFTTMPTNDNKKMNANDRQAPAQRLEDFYDRKRGTFTNDFRVSDLNLFGINVVKL